MEAGVTYFSRMHVTSIVIGAWLLVAFAWTPPTVLVERGTVAPLLVLAFVIVGFTPWMAATPLFLKLGSRFPVVHPHAARNVAIHAMIGFVAVPLIVALGQTFSSLCLSFFAAPAPVLTASGFMSAVTISALYSVPTYIAAVAVIQTALYLESYRNRERMLARAELRTLQAQINPHFLFNTLNAISTLGYRDGALADRALTRLSDVLRLSLRERPQEVALKDEIAYVNAYLDIYAVLMGERLRTEFNIDPAAWTAAVPAMILQPLFENALVHGIARREGPGTIAFRARVEGRVLVLRLRNDPPDSAEPEAPSSGIGLANVRERLSVLYGRAQAVDFAADPASGARVVLRMPFRPVEVEA